MLQKLDFITFLRKKNSIWKLIFIFFVIFSFVANAFHESYPDEFDNILGGWYILQGKLPYIGFFTHHGPVPYFIASVITFFSGQSFVAFRIIYSIFLLSAVFGIYYFFRKRVGKQNVTFFPFFIAFLGIESTYYWFQMILADNIAALAFLPAYGLILLKTILGKKITLFDVGAISVFSAIGLYSSLTYAYLFLIINAASLYGYLRDRSIKKIFEISSFYPFLLILAPHFIFGIYLLLTGSIREYYYQNFTFNTNYYIYNYPRPNGATFINPIRYAILIAHWFFINFYTLLIGIKSLDFSFPINTTMAVANTGLFIYLLLRKNYKLAIFVLLTIIFTNIRSNPLNSKETDYQAGVYNMLSFFNLFLLLPQLYSSINDKIETSKKIIFGFLLILVGAYGFFAFQHLLFKFNEKTVSKYMGDMALIYDRPKLAPVLNVVADKNEYVWAGPFEFEELFYTNAKIPSRYHILINGVGRSEKISSEMLSDFNKNKPKVIMFDSNFTYLGIPVKEYSRVFLDFLDKNYITLLNYKNGNMKYQSVAKISVEEKLDLDAKMYIRKDALDDVIKRLLEANYIKAAVVN